MHVLIFVWNAENAAIAAMRSATDAPTRNAVKCASSVQKRKALIVPNATVVISAFNCGVRNAENVRIVPKYVTTAPLTWAKVYYVLTAPQIRKAIVTASNLTKSAQHTSVKSSVKSVPRITTPIAPLVTAATEIPAAGARNAVNAMNARNCVFIAVKKWV